MRDIIRLLIAPWYLVGWVSHVYLGLNSPEIYRQFGQTALISTFAGFWYNTVMPQITILALLLAGFEISVGILLISKERWVKAGVALSIAFNVFLLHLGLSYPASDGVSDFLVNRLPNIVFIVLQVPLFRGRYTKSLPAVIQGWLKRPSSA